MPEPMPDQWDEKQRLSETKRVEASRRQYKFRRPFAVRALLVLLWLTVIGGVLTSVLVPVLALTLPGEVRLTLPAEIKYTEPGFTSTVQTGPLGVSLTSPALPEGKAAFLASEGQYSVPATQLGSTVNGFILLVSSVLILAWSYAAWLLLGIVQSLPQPFTHRNARRLVTVAWLGVAINLTNSLLGTLLGRWMTGQVTGAPISGLDPTVTGTPTIAFGQALDPSLQVPWIMVLSAFVLALIFRIGVQQRDNEARLLAEQELTV
jgi:Protein of unknown function (DUF2975)